MAVEGHSLPSNYVTILQLKERWLQQHPQKPAKSNPAADEDDSQPNDDGALSRVPFRKPNRHRVVKKLVPEVAIDDSGSKTQPDVADNHPKVEKEEQKTDHSDSKLSKKKKSSRTRKPRVVSDQNPNGDGSGSPLLKPEVVKEIKQTQQVGGRRGRNRNVVSEPNDGMTPFAQNVDELSHKDSSSRGVVEAVSAAVNLPNAGHGTNRRLGYGRFQGKPKPKPSWGINRPSEPPFGVKKGQTSFVWVKKGESPAN